MLKAVSTTSTKSTKISMFNVFCHYMSHYIHMAALETCCLRGQHPIYYLIVNALVEHIVLKVNVLSDKT